MVYISVFITDGPGFVVCEIRTFSFSVWFILMNSICIEIHLISQLVFETVHCRSQKYLYPFELQIIQPVFYTIQPAFSATQIYQSILWII